jgi:photosystem II stability/assembly factor-like uncharacterized protein
LLCGLTAGVVNAQSVTVLQQGKPTSIRGLSVVNDHVAWISGSKGYVALTTDGGQTWNWQQVKGFEKSDFRDIEAFSDQEAIIMSSGTPAVILKTVDGGSNWQIKYQRADTAYFFDAMSFDGKKKGMVLGDPIGGKFLLMQTVDGGDSWRPFANPPEAAKDEAAFAASGTCLRFDKLITIVTGGARSRMLFSPVDDPNWLEVNLPLTDGKQSRGAFSVAYGKDQIIIVGGDYQKDKKTDSTVYIQAQAKASYKATIPAMPPSGYQSCVEFLSDETFLSTGTPGTNITTDGGKTWTRIDSTSYNVCRKAKKGSLVLLAGNNGDIGVFKP